MEETAPRAARLRHDGRGELMRCSPELLDAYVDGELEQDTRRRLERHLWRCRRCQTEIDDLQALKGALWAAAKAEADLAPETERRHIADIVGRVRFQEARRRRERPRKRFWQGAVVGGAVGAVAVAAVVVVLMTGGGRFGDERHAYAATVEAVVSEHAQLEMLLELGVDDWADWYMAWEREP